MPAHRAGTSEYGRTGARSRRNANARFRHHFRVMLDEAGVLLPALRRAAFCLKGCCPSGSAQVSQEERSMTVARRRIARCCAATA
jgi:hypothetical protein